MTWSKLILDHINLSALAVAAKIQVLEAQSDEPTPNTWYNGLVVRTEQNENTENFFYHRGVDYKLKTS